MEFARFMSSPLGRGIRILAGLALVVAGLAWIGSTGGVLLAVGALPVVAGAGNFCLFAPLFGGPFLGSKLAPKT